MILIRHFDSWRARFMSKAEQEVFVELQVKWHDWYDCSKKKKNNVFVGQGKPAVLSCAKLDAALLVQGDFFVMFGGDTSAENMHKFF